MEEYTIEDMCSSIEDLEKAKRSIIDTINSSQLDKEELNYAEELLKKYDNAIRILEESNNGK